MYTRHSVAAAIMAKRCETGRLSAIIIEQQVERTGIALPGLLFGRATEAEIMLQALNNVPLWAVAHCSNRLEIRAENGIWTLDQLLAL